MLIKAQPPLEFIPPNFNPLALKTGQVILPWWLKFKTNITKIEAKQTHKLVDLYQQFTEGKVRFILAFRHPSSDDPLCLAYLMWELVTKAWAHPGKIAHAHFIYDRGIPLWAGDWVGGLYSSLGGTSIQRGKMDWVGLRSARQLFLHGDFPIAAAPEGATNGHNGIISPLEPGIAQLSFWCAEDIAKTGREEQVLVLPLGLQYFYVDAPWQAIANLLSQLEAECKIKPSGDTSATPEALYPRLLQLGEYILELMEKFYQRFYGQELTASGDSLPQRLPVLLDTALKVAENYFSLPAKGNFSDRCRRLEQAGWDYIYREDYRDLQKLSSLERGLANLVAEEAALRMWHMRLAETFVAATGSYVRENPSVERFAETSLLLWDFVARIKGMNPFKRPKLGKQRVEITIAEPINVTERYPDYINSRRRAILKLTQDLQESLTALIQ